MGSSKIYELLVRIRWRFVPDHVLSVAFRLPLMAGVMAVPVMPTD